MALTRKFLSALGIEADKIDEIIDAHAETVTALKAQNAELTENANKVADLQKKLDDATARLAQNDPTKLQGDYDALKKEFEDYKIAEKAQADKVAKTNAYKSMLTRLGIKSDKLISTICASTDMSAIKLNENGEIDDADEIVKSVKTDWAEFIPETVVGGAKPQNPPSGGGKEPVEVPTIF